MNHTNSKYHTTSESVINMFRTSLWILNWQTHMRQFGTPTGIANFYLSLKYLHGMFAILQGWFTIAKHLFLNA